jgi:hypothetical protein
MAASKIAYQRNNNNIGMRQRNAYGVSSSAANKRREENNRNVTAK